MAELQYIGARYVPKFYENPNTGDMTWKSGVGYEPLTVVKYNDDTYTSKKPVPSSIGNPAANTSYWAKTADYNAALAAIQQDVLDLQNDVGDVNNLLTDNKTVVGAINEMLTPPNRKYIFIGDSYADADKANWAGQYISRYGLTVGVDAWVSQAGGTRFADNTFKNLLANLDNIIVNKDEITDIFVMGGANDCIEAECPVADIQAGKAAFLSYAATKYPNARVHTGFIGVFEADSNRPYSYMYEVLRAYQGSNSTNGDYVTGIEYMTHWLLQGMIDHVHPTAAVGQFIAVGMRSFLNNGQTTFSRYQTTVAYGSKNIMIEWLKNRCFITFNEGLALTPGLAISGSGLSSMTELSSTTNLYFNEPVIIVTSGKLGGQWVTIYLKFIASKLYAGCMNGGTSLTIQSGDSINMISNTLRIEINPLALV